MHWYGKLSKKFTDFESGKVLVRHEQFSLKALIDEKKLKTKKHSSNYNHYNKIKIVKVQTSCLVVIYHKLCTYVKLELQVRQNMH